jgi:hypothetical protein
MNKLTVFEQNGQLLIGSNEVVSKNIVSLQMKLHQPPGRY